MVPLSRTNAHNLNVDHIFSRILSRGTRGSQRSNFARSIGRIIPNLLAGVVIRFVYAEVSEKISQSDARNPGIHKTPC